MVTEMKLAGTLTVGERPSCLVLVKRTEKTYNTLHRHVFRNVMVTIPFRSLTVMEMGWDGDNHQALTR
jgi:hypothetical protein